MATTGSITRSVMVVEDDDAIRLVLRTNLEDEGYRVLEAANGQDGILKVLQGLTSMEEVRAQCSD